MRNSFLVKSRPPGLRCLPHDRQSPQTRRFIKPTRTASLTDPIRAGLHRKYEDPFSALRTAPKDNPAVWDYYGSVRKFDPQLGVIGPLQKQDHVLTENEPAKSMVDQKSESNIETQTDPEYELWRRSIEPLLVSRGGRWTITEDGTGLERYFTFKTFAKAWNFMSAIVPECKSNRHHPEWSNTYRTVFIRWRTHEPDNHISLLDIKLAVICDEQAKAFGEVVPDAETSTTPEEQTALPPSSPTADTAIASTPDASSTAAAVNTNNPDSDPDLTTTTTATAATDNSDQNEQIDVPREPAAQIPPEPSTAAQSTPRQVEQLPQEVTESAIQVVVERLEEGSPSETCGEQQENYEAVPEPSTVVQGPPSQVDQLPQGVTESTVQVAVQPLEEGTLSETCGEQQKNYEAAPEPSKSVQITPKDASQLLQEGIISGAQVIEEPLEKGALSESPGEQQEKYEQRPEEEKKEESFSQTLSSEEVLQQDEKCLEETVARIRKRNCTLEEVQETIRTLTELASRQQSGVYKFTIPLSQERVKIEKEISDRLKFFRRANHELRQAKKMERRLKRERAEKAQQLQTPPPLPEDRLGEMGGPKSQLSEAKTKPEARVLAEKEEEKPPDRVGWFQSLFRHLR